MKQLFYVFFFVFVIIFSGCKQKPSTFTSNPSLALPEKMKVIQDLIIEKHLKNGAYNFPLYSQQWQKEIDKGLAKDSTIAYLWQQKAMPLFKQGKYEKGMEFIDKAVKYNPQRWQDYRAFIKCIFAKTYKDAIADFKDYEEKYGYGFVMDHSYQFHIGLSYLQLNEFEKAERVFEKDYNRTIKNYGEENLHHLDLFYFGISKYEQQKYAEAIVLFDKALDIYPKFSDVQAYKAYALGYLENYEEAQKLYEEAEMNGKNGNTINEDNVIYERYPYQIRWR